MCYRPSTKAISKYMTLPMRHYQILNQVVGWKIDMNNKNITVIITEN